MQQIKKWVNETRTRVFDTLAVINIPCQILVLSYSCLKLLLDRGANPEVGDGQNWTPLHLAATSGHTSCCRLLLEHGARLNVCSTVSLYPLISQHSSLFHSSDLSTQFCFFVKKKFKKIYYLILLGTILCLHPLLLNGDRYYSKFQIKFSIIIDILGKKF